MTLQTIQAQSTGSKALANGWRWPHPIQPTPQPEHRTCLGCGARHPINPDGTPVGGALPCGH